MPVTVNDADADDDDDDDDDEADASDDAVTNDDVGDGTSTRRGALMLLGSAALVLNTYSSE